MFPLITYKDIILEINAQSWEKYMAKYVIFSLLMLLCNEGRRTIIMLISFLHSKTSIMDSASYIKQAKERL